ncbi:MAG: hypothetical protein ACYC7E_18540 [Armatimonadota bacterium]
MQGSVGRMIRWALPVLGSVLLLLVAGCTAGGSLPFDPADPGGTQPPALPANFSSTAGYRGWYYYQAPSGTQNYQALTWGAAPAGTPYSITECWGNGASSGPLIARTALCPGPGVDAVIAWRVSTAGLVQVSVTLQARRIDAAGDGIAASIWQNAQRIVEPANIPNNGQSQTLTTMRTMQAGDIVYIRIDPREIGGDWFSYGVTIQPN